MTNFKDISQLIVTAQKGDINARNEVIERNLGLVHKVNSQFGNTEDGFQSGIFGLISAINKYDEKKGSFSNYATLWIKQKIMRHLQKQNYNCSHRDAEFSKKYLYLLDQGLSEDEIKIKLNVTEKTFNFIKNNPFNKYIFLDDDYQEKDDESHLAIESNVYKRELQDLMKEHCSDKECFVITKIFFEGLNGEEVAQLLKCSRERVRTIKNSGLSKLRRVLWK